MQSKETNLQTDWSKTQRCCAHVESCTQEELREDSPILPMLPEHAGSIQWVCVCDVDVLPANKM